MNSQFDLFGVFQTRTHPLSIQGPILEETSMIWLMVIIACARKGRRVARDSGSPLSFKLASQFDLDPATERPGPASVHSSLLMTWHSWRTRAFLGLLILAFQFWPSTTETPVTGTNHATEWSPNRTVVLRSVLRSTSLAISNCRRSVVRGCEICGIMVLIIT